MDHPQIRQFKSRRKGRRESRTSQCGFLLVSVCALFSTGTRGYTNSFQSPVRRSSSLPSTSLFSSTDGNSEKTMNARKRIDEFSSGGRWRQKTKPMPVTGYDAQGIEEFYDRRPLQVGWRLNSLGFPLLGMCNYRLFASDNLEKLIARICILYRLVYRIAYG